MLLPTFFCQPVKKTDMTSGHKTGRKQNKKKIPGKMDFCRNAEQQMADLYMECDERPVS